MVASLVVFEDGLAKKSDYRRFEIRDAAERFFDPAKPVRKQVRARAHGRNSGPGGKRRPVTLPNVDVVKTGAETVG